MLVARSALSGIAGHYSGHPLRTRCVLADAAGTARAVFLCSVERLRRVARLPVLFSRRCESGRLAGLPAVRLIRAPVVSAGMLLKRSPLATAPVSSAGVVLGPTRWALPDDLHGGEAMSGSQIPASVCPEGQLLARIVDAPRTRGKRRLRVCVARVSRHLCANRGKASPHAGKGVRQDPSPAWGRDPAREAVQTRIRPRCATRPAKRVPWVDCTTAVRR